MGRILQNPVKATPIGITLPIQDGNSGYFQQSFDTLTQIKSNITNLLNTRPGERRMQPTFGSNLWNLVFEPNLDSLRVQAVKTITDDISMWINGVTVTNVTANILTNSQISSDTDNYMLNIIVSFMVNSTKQSDVVAINMNLLGNNINNLT